MKRVGFLLFALTMAGVFSVEAKAARIDIHYAFADPSADSLSLLELIQTEQKTLGSARIEFLSAARQAGVQIKTIPFSKTELVLESLRDPEVLGLIWVGHTSRDMADDGSIYNGHLMGADKSFLPRHLFTAAHPGLKWIGFVGCDLSAILHRYAGLGRANLEVLEPAQRSPKTSEATHALLGLKDLFQKAGDRIAADLASFAPSSRSDKTRWSVLQISHRDLYSTKFSYEVLVNGVYVGQIQPSVATFGKTTVRKPSGKTEIRFPSRTPTSRDQITIVPNDSNRKTMSYPYPIDNILVDQVNWDGKPAWNGPVNLGDNDQADQEMAKQGVILFHPTHLADLQKNAPQSELKVEVVR